MWSDVAYPRLDGSNIPGRDEGELKPGAEAAPLGRFSALGVPPEPGLEQQCRTGKASCIFPLYLRTANVPLPNAPGL